MSALPDTQKWKLKRLQLLSDIIKVGLDGLSTFCFVLSFFWELETKLYKRGFHKSLEIEYQDWCYDHWGVRVYTVWPLYVDNSNVCFILRSNCITSAIGSFIRRLTNVKYIKLLHKHSYVLVMCFIKKECAENLSFFKESKLVSELTCWKYSHILTWNLYVKMSGPAITWKKNDRQ